MPFLRDELKRRQSFLHELQNEAKRQKIRKGTHLGQDGLGYVPKK